MSVPATLRLQPVKRVRDADGGYCPTCGEGWDYCSNFNLPWRWRQAQVMHERGTGHRTVLVRFDWQPV